MKTTTRHVKPNGSLTKHGAVIAQSLVRQRKNASRTVLNSLNRRGAGLVSSRLHPRVRQLKKKGIV